MPREFQRSQRVADAIQRVLPDLIRREVKDPRMSAISITAVEVSRDLSHARVFFTPFAGQGDAAQILEALRSAVGFLRRALRGQLTLRSVPELEFRLDESIERGARVAALIAEAIAEDRKHAAPEGDEEP
ncbi:MAG: 30S ribosome-binding factor RbfA [Steroidobacteraceae bacterium]